MLIKKHYKAFAKFTKQIDKIKEMNSKAFRSTVNKFYKTFRSTVNKLTRRKKNNYFKYQM